MKLFTSASICISAQPAKPPAAIAANAAIVATFTTGLAKKPPITSPIQRPIFVRPSGRGAQHTQHAFFGTVRQQSTSRPFRARRHSSTVSHATNQVHWKKNVNKIPNAA
tara:strand:- start:1685 stop:2011 length:327 start_codon:yes stop_codon:yes gene_type:complete